MGKRHVVVTWKPHLMNGDVSRNGRIFESYCWELNETTGERFVIYCNNKLPENQRWKLVYFKSEQYHSLFIGYYKNRWQAQQAIHSEFDKNKCVKLVYCSRDRIIGKVQAETE